ncbi:aquaporin Z [Chromatiales bacterium (ex Bugula neritina AB1)]|nr:aquaporin Z [Chromatiales bacterium (ex Bugula neritina AB1)]
MHFHNKYLAEFFGTFWLVLGGCGSAVFAATFSNDIGINIGLVGVSLAFGLTVMTMAYAVGHVSGGHFNPAVSIGLWVGGRFGFGHLIPYIVFQVLGAIAAAFVLQWMLKGAPGNEAAIATLASNGYDGSSPGGFNMQAVIVMEVVMTAFFLIIIMGATDERAPKGFAPIAIGLGLTLIHLISIPVSNTSVNPARSTGPALVANMFGGGDETLVTQLPVFWIAPIVGAVLGAIIYRLIVSGAAPAETEVAPRVETRDSDYHRDYRHDGRGVRDDYRDDRVDYRDDYRGSQDYRDERY